MFAKSNQCSKEEVLKICINPANDEKLTCDLDQNQKNIQNHHDSLHPNYFTSHPYIRLLKTSNKSMIIQETCFGGDGICKLEAKISCKDLDDEYFLQAKVSVIEAPKKGILFDSGRFELVCESLKKKKKKRDLSKVGSVRNLIDMLEAEFLKNSIAHRNCDELSYKEMRMIVLGLLDKFKLKDKRYEEFSRFG